MTALNEDAVLVDLDGTVCDVSHRQHLIADRANADWRAYSLQCYADKPVPNIIGLVRFFYDEGLRIALVSGRHEAARTLTEEWCADNHLAYDMLVLRAEGDHTPNAEYKVQAVKQLARDGYSVVYAIDDFHKAADALRSVGVPTLLVPTAGEHHLDTK